jgi:hypothetical protein
MKQRAECRPLHLRQRRRKIRPKRPFDKTHGKALKSLVSSCTPRIDGFL